MEQPVASGPKGADLYYCANSSKMPVAALSFEDDDVVSHSVADPLVFLMDCSLVFLYSLFPL
jgi:hypothetical protein